MTLPWHVCKYRVHKLHHMYILKKDWGCTSGGIYVPCIYTHARYINSTRSTSSWKTVDVPLVEFMYPVFTHMPVESYHGRLRSLLLSLCYVFQALVNSLVRWFCMNSLGLVLFQICSNNKFIHLWNYYNLYITTVADAHLVLSLLFHFSKW